MTGTRGIWLAFAVFSLGCDVAVSEPGGVVELRAEVANSVSLNSAALNGWRLNGFRTNGWSLNGWRLNGWRLNGWNLNAVGLSGTSFSGTRVIDGQSVQVSGTQMIGAELELEHSGVLYTLRFDDIYKDPAKPTGDVYFYEISVLDPATDTWNSLCTDSDGDPTQAIPLANWWDLNTGARINDPTAVTFACRDAVLAKCVEWGYRPWATAPSCVGTSCTNVSLADHHQACTRMARADYCGNGVAHTFNGTPIDIFDQLSPRLQKPATSGMSDWGIEAEWGPNGAVCVGDRLRLKMFDDLDEPYTYPSCLDAIDDFSNCGSLPSSRSGKLADRFCDKWTAEPEACDGFHGDDSDDEDD